MPNPDIALSLKLAVKRQSRVTYEMIRTKCDEWQEQFYLFVRKIHGTKRTISSLGTPIEADSFESSRKEGEGEEMKRDFEGKLISFAREKANHALIERIEIPGGMSTDIEQGSSTFRWEFLFMVASLDRDNTERNLSLAVF